MIHVSAKTFDISGSISFAPLPSEAESVYERRVSRVATLDGGVAITDGGYSDGDRTLEYSYKSISKAHDDRAKRIIEIHPLVTVATPEGVFEAVPQSFRQSPDTNRISFLVNRKLSED